MNVDDVARVEAETKLFLPVTWLEATVFFALVLVLEPRGSDDHENGKHCSSIDGDNTKRTRKT